MYIRGAFGCVENVCIVVDSRIDVYVELVYELLILKRYCDE